MRPLASPKAWVLLSLLVSPAVWANGRLPLANQLVTDGERVLVRTTFGIVVSNDRGNTWDWVCENGAGYDGIQDPPLQLMPDGAIFVATAAGLYVSRNGLCDVKPVPGFERYLVDTTQAPSGFAYVLSSQYKTTLDGGELTFDSSLVETNGSETRAIQANLAPSFLFETVESAASDPSRIYLSAASTSEPASSIVMVSNDRGQTFTSVPVPILPAVERAAFVSGVDNANADRVYIRTGGLGGNPGRLLVSDDGAQTFREVFAGQGPLLGFALSSDGKRVFIGGPSDGVYSADTTSLRFEKQSELGPHCLTFHNGTLWACGNGRGGVLASSSTDDGKTFTTRATFRSIRGPLQGCSPDASTRVCSAQWPALQRELGLVAQPPDVGTSLDAPTAPSATLRGTGGCETASGSSAMVLIALVASMLRRAARRRV